MHRYLNVLFWLLTITGMATATPSITLPPSNASAFPIQITLISPIEQRDVQLGAAGRGTTNVTSILNYDALHQPERIFTGDTATAHTANGEWVSAQYGRWNLNVGTGQSETYTGNRDAGQLWLDLHTDSPMTRTYAPQASMTAAQLTWCGVGYTVPFTRQRLRGACRIGARYLQANDITLGNALGNVHGEDFTGMARTVTLPGNAKGHGWATDVQLTMTHGPRWSAQVTVDGLLGEVTCQKVKVLDASLVSLSVFEDPEGFLHDFWGGSGAEWESAVTMQIDPTIAAGLTYHGAPQFTVYVQHDVAETVPTLITAFDWPKNCTTALGISPIQQRYSLGVNTPYGSVNLGSGDWNSGSPRHLSFSLQTRPITFSIK